MTSCNSPAKLNDKKINTTTTNVVTDGIQHLGLCMCTHCISSVITHRPSISDIHPAARGAIPWSRLITTLWVNKLPETLIPDDGVD